MKAVAKFDIINGKAVVVFTDGSEQEMYEFPSDEGGGGGTQPVLGTKNIINNGIYNAEDDGYDGYSSVNVSVPVVTVNDILERNFPSGDIEYNGNIYMSPVLNHNFNVTGFKGTGTLTFTSGYTFADCSNLNYISIYKAITTNLFDYFAYKCIRLHNVSLPNLRGQISSHSFDNCPALEKIDCGFTTALKSYCFQKCSDLKTIILRKSASYVTVDGANVFLTSPYANGGSGGNIYVPSDLIETYKVAPVWSTLYGYGSITFLPIEGSEYENATVDGTPIT